MRKALAVLAICLTWIAPAVAQNYSALAQFDPERSALEGDDNGAALVLTLSQRVPYRVHTLAYPPRLVLDFREVAFDARTGPALLSEAVIGLRHGRFQPGWSRLVLDLAEPLAVVEAGMETGAADGSVQLRVRLEKVSDETFLALSGIPPSSVFTLPERPKARQATQKPPGAPLVIVLDPGHGGIDPGAVRARITEADLMLRFALELKESLLRTGDYEVVLTRDDDVFVSLEARIAKARRARADLFLSLHADALAVGIARGAQVYTLSEEASSIASQRLAERHDRGDLLAGVDLSGADDRIATVLMDLARQETAPRSLAFAELLITALRDAGIRLHKRPLETAGFSVLKSPEVPSVLLEIGFLSSPEELEKLQSPEWRARAIAALTRAIDLWAEQDAAHRALRRQ